MGNQIFSKGRALCFATIVTAVTAGLLTSAETLFPLFSPVIALLLGGFILSVAIHKYGLDKKITVLTQVWRKNF